MRMQRVIGTVLGFCAMGMQMLAQEPSTATSSDERLLRELVAPEVSLQQINQLTVQGLFTDGMILQRDQAVSIWGWGPEGAEVEVAFAGQTVKTKIAGHSWSVTLAAMSANSQGQELRISSGSRTITLRDVLVGDVWLCAGQSNMQVEMKLDVKAYPKRKADIQKTNNPLIRFYKIDSASSRFPRRDVPPIHDDPYFPWVNSFLNNTWRPCQPQWSSHISAIGFYFATTLQPQINVPVGIIHAARGATSIYHWVPAEAIVGTPCWSPYERKLLADASTNWDAYVHTAAEPWKQFHKLKELSTPESKRALPPAPIKWPGCYFNGIIHPLAPFSVRGVLWYQGEGDAAVPAPYADKMVCLITTWRKLWNRPDLPFIITQLAGFEGSKNNWPALREAQSKVPQAVSNTYMATAIDAGMRANIHPYQKEIVGERLALVARKEVYGEKLVAYGPTFMSATFKGEEALVRFSNVGGGLVARAVNLDGTQLPADILEGFEVAGKTGGFVKADAKIVGNEVVVRAATVANPVAVRYAWANFPLANLYNKEGLPCFPFQIRDSEGAK